MGDLELEAVFFLSNFFLLLFLFIFIIFFYFLKVHNATFFTVNKERDRAFDARNSSFAGANMTFRCTLKVHYVTFNY